MRRAIPIPPNSLRSVLRADSGNLDEREKDSEREAAAFNAIFQDLPAK
jgi:hypothetical protein